MYVFLIFNNVYLCLLMCGCKYRCLWRPRKDVICPRTGVIDYHVPPSVDACIVSNKQIIKLKKMYIGFCIFLLMPYIMYPYVIIHTENNRNLNVKSDRFDRSVNLITFIT